MIFSVNGNVRIEGVGVELMAEATCILHELYQMMAKHGGEDFANEQLVLIGRLAVLNDEEIKDGIKNL